MKLNSVTTAEVEITLSERNLRALIAKLRHIPPDSACTIVRKEPGKPWLVIHAEQDSEHYHDREPGLMHPQTERAMAEI